MPLKPEHNETYSDSARHDAICRRCETPLDWSEIEPTTPDGEPIVSAFCCGLYYDCETTDGTVSITYASNSKPYTQPAERQERPVDDPVGQITEDEEYQITELQHAVCNRCNSELEWHSGSESSPTTPPFFGATCCDRVYEFTATTAVATVNKYPPTDPDHSDPPESCTFGDELYSKQEP